MVMDTVVERQIYNVNNFGIDMMKMALIVQRWTHMRKYKEIDIVSEMLANK